MYIVLEGVDGSGKTAIAKRLAFRHQGLYWKHLNDTSVHPAWLREKVPGLNDAAEEMVIARFLQEALVADDVIQDRGFWSANVYRAFHERGALPRAVQDYYWQECLPKQTLYVWVKRPLTECRLERFDELQLYELEQLFEEAYMTCPLPVLNGRNFPAKVILYNNSTVDDACARISNAITHGGRNGIGL